MKRPSPIQLSKLKFIKTPHQVKVRGKLVPKFYSFKYPSVKDDIFVILKGAYILTKSLFGYGLDGLRSTRTFWKAHKPKHIQVTFKITLTRIIIFSVLIANFWPHPSKIVAEPAPDKPSVSSYKPLKQVKLKEQSTLAKKIIKPVYKPVVGVTGCGSGYKALIYQRESGCRTNAINASSGACGLGQALPCSKMGCSLSDWACQDRFFTSYALSRYGSWEAAWAFWTAHNYW